MDAKGFELLMAAKILGKGGGSPTPPVLVDKTITENGTYNAVDDDADGYKSVVVEVNPTPPEPPADGKTRLYITLTDGRLSPVLGLGVNGSVDVDWGDGTAHGTLTGTSTSTLATIPHTYAHSGEYIITLTAAEGTTMAVFGTSTASLILSKDGTATDEAQVYRTSLKKAYLGNSVTSIGNYAFANCYNLTSITISDGVTSLGVRAFFYCYGLTSVTIPDSVTVIGSTAFGYCYSLTSVIIPDSVANIGDYAFYICTSLTSITIPDSVTSIGGNAFSGCFGLCFIMFESTTPPTAGGSTTFGSLPTDCVIYVPEGTLEAYTSATNYPDPDVYSYIEY